MLSAIYVPTPPAKGQSIPFSIIICKFAAKLGLARPTYAVDNEASLFGGFSEDLRLEKPSTQLGGFLFSAGIERIDKLRNIEELVCAGLCERLLYRIDRRGDSFQC